MTPEERAEEIENGLRYDCRTPRMESETVEWNRAIIAEAIRQAIWDALMSGNGEEHVTQAINEERKVLALERKAVGLLLERIDTFDSLARRHNYPGHHGPQELRNAFEALRAWRRGE